MKKIINFTPHTINLWITEANVLEFPSAGIARVDEVDVIGKPIILENGIKIPTATKQYKDVIGLPKQQDNVIYIVSIVVLNALRGKRNDLCSPDTGTGGIRDKDGKIIATKRFIF